MCSPERETTRSGALQAAAAARRGNRRRSSRAARRALTQLEIRREKKPSKQRLLPAAPRRHDTTLNPAGGHVVRRQRRALPLSPAARADERRKLPCRSRPRDERGVVLLQKPLRMLRLGEDGLDGRLRALELEMLLLLQIRFEVLVSLDEALRVRLLLPDLLPAVALDPLQQRGEGALLPLPQALLQAADPLLVLGGVLSRLPLLEVLGRDFDLLSFSIVPELRKSLLLPFQLLKFAAWFGIRCNFSSYAANSAAWRSRKRSSDM